MNVTVCMTTWAPDNQDGEWRREAAHTALKSWGDLLSTNPLRLHIADDGSALPGYPDVLASDPAIRIGYDEVMRSRGERKGVGASLNRALADTFGHDGVGLYLVDDWVLLEPLNLDPWVDLLARHDDIGMVRIGIPHPGLTGTVEHEDGLWWLRLDRHHFAFGHRPALYHHRMIDAYGWFDEGVNAYEAERLYNERFKVTPGPDIVYALPRIWEPILTTEFADVVPG